MKNQIDGSQRKAIRKAVREMLLGKTKAGNNVFTNQSTPTWVEDLPVILIYSRSEDSNIFAESPREHKRDVNVVVEMIATGPEDPNQEDIESGKCQFLDDILDDMAEDVECALSVDDTLKCTASDINLSSTEFSFEGEGNLPLGSVRLIYTVTYYTLYPKTIDKQDGVTDFSGANVDWKVGHDSNEEGNESPDNVVEAEDTIDIV